MNLRDYVSNQDRRYCYLELSTLERTLKNDRIVDGLLKQLEAPGKPAVLKALPPKEKLAAIEHQINSFRSSSTSVWSKVDFLEVLAASVFRASLDGALPQKLGLETWSAVKTEATLAVPVAHWLKAKGLVTYQEVPLGTKRADVVGFKDNASGILGFLSGGPRVLAVELKNENEQLKRGLDQMTTFAQYAHGTYLACTPHFAADYLERHSAGAKVKHWDATVLDEKLSAFGIGLLLVEGTAVTEVLKPKERPVAEGKFDQVRHAIRTAKGI